MSKERKSETVILKTPFRQGVKTLRDRSHDFQGLSTIRQTPIRVTTFPSPRRRFRANTSSKPITNKVKFVFTETDMKNEDDRDYGLVPLQEVRTPFPHELDPVDPGCLRTRLNLELSKLNSKQTTPMSLGDIDVGKFLASNNNINYRKHLKTEEFLRKRKQIEYGEFTITRQRLMGNSLHPPGLPPISKHEKSIVPDAECVTYIPFFITPIDIEN